MSAQATDLSFEFFPPRSGDASTSFEKTLVALRELSPDFCSVTYGAGGSTRDGTFQTVTKLQSTGVATAAHLSMGNESEDSIGELLGDYTSAGVQRIVALRRDTTSGSGSGAPRYAEELVRFIRAHSGDKFHVTVAAYPETHPDAPSPEADLDFFKRKVDAGADTSDAGDARADASNEVWPAVSLPHSSAGRVRQALRQNAGLQDRSAQHQGGWNAELECNEVVTPAGKGMARRQS